MLPAITKIFQILTSAERRRAYMLTLLMAGLAVIEVTGILSITPFLAILGNPDMVHTNRRLNMVYAALDFHDPQTFLYTIGIASFVILVAASIFRAFVQHARAHYVNASRHEIGLRLMQNYIRQPYSFFLKSNSSQLSNMALSEIDHFILSGLMPLLLLISSGFVIFSVAGLLLAVNFKLAVTVACLLGFFYGSIYLRLGRKMTRLGQSRRDTNVLRFQIAAEIFGGIKELKVLGREGIYLQAYEGPSLRFSRSQTIYQSLSEIPRYIIEALGFCALFLVVFYTVRQNLDLGHSLPLIGLYAFAGYRLLPAAQNFYSSLTALRFAGPIIDSLHDDMARTADNSELPSQDKQAGKLPLRESIVLRNLSFAYPDAERQTLKDVSAVLPAGASIGIVGATGAGKSTLVDLLLGLLSPTAGAVLIDGTPLAAGNARAWQSNVGYVPQSIFLSDDTVARNIAFGVPAAEIDLAAAEHAARLAQIHEFVARELPDGYATKIGDRGVRLSGGQRQRLGIARALYNNPDILIFDEATSALDAETERDVIAAIETLFGQKTILMIAHRQETLRNCGLILRIENGGIELRENIGARVGRDG